MVDEHEVDPALQRVDLAREIVVLEVALLHRAEEFGLEERNILYFRFEILACL